MRRHCRLIVSMLALRLSAYACSPLRQRTTPVGGAAADIIFTDAKILTTDGAAPVARAVAVRGNRIVEVGGDAGMAGYRGPATAVVNLIGRTLVPGFVDAHQYRVQSTARQPSTSQEVRTVGTWGERRRQNRR